MPTIALTGACGVLGSAAGAVLEAAGYTVLPVDLRTGTWPRVPVDILVHCAGDARVWYADVEYARSYDVNVDGIRCAAEAARDIGGVQHVVLASSVCVYAECNAARMPLGESAHLAERPSYGLIKVRCEATCFGQLPTTALRFGGLYGPGAKKGLVYDLETWVRVHTVDESIAKYAEQVLQERWRRTSVYHLCSLEDAAKAILLAVQQRPQGAYNIVTGQPRNVESWAAEYAPGLVVDDRGPGVYQSFDNARWRALEQDAAGASPPSERACAVFAALQAAKKGCTP
jgi:nucleoside-diphosphate-sugar epimerase